MGRDTAAHFFSDYRFMARRILIVHHSASGGTRALVSRVVAGASATAGVEVRTRSAEVASRDDLLAADALVFATPENFGYMAGTLKAFFDRCFYACMADTTAEGGGSVSLLAGRPCALIVCAGNDGRGAAQSVERIVTGWRLRHVAPPLIARRVGGAAGSSRGALAAADLDAAFELGQLLAEGLAIGAL